MAVVMHDIEGYKHEEIARAFCVPVGTVKSRLSRARQALRDDLTRGGRRHAEEDWR
jgi:RNA polymerase sigma-70 factor (ECF subfamily)